MLRGPRADALQCAPTPARGRAMKASPSSRAAQSGDVGVGEHRQGDMRATAARTLALSLTKTRSIGSKWGEKAGR